MKPANKPFQSYSSAKTRTVSPSYPSTGIYWFSAVGIIFAWFIIGLPKQPAVQFVNEETSVSRWNQMKETLIGVLNQYDGEAGIYIKDLKTGQTFEYQADRLFLSASLIKLPIMAATFQAITEGKLSLDLKLRYNRRHRRDGSGNMKWARPGTYFKVSQLVYTMVTRSDNTAAAILIDKLGYGYLNKCFEDFGLETTRISPLGMSLSNHVNPAVDNYTTPREMGVFLEKIYQRQLASNHLSELMLDFMKGSNSRNRLARDLPEDWKLAHKTGLLRKNCHDVGIVFTPDGDYVICVLTSQNQDYKIAKGFISSVGRKVYGFMRNS